MQAVRSFLFLGYALMMVIVFASAVVLCAPFPNRHALASRLARNWARTVLAGLKAFCNLDYAVDGLQHLPRSPSVMMIKHQSAFETIVQIATFPPQTWVLKRELMWIPLFGQALAILKPIAIDRGAGGSALEQVVEQGRERLREGLWVMVFPEGTRVSYGQAGRYRAGGAALAVAAGCDIVPLAHNCGRFWGRRSLTKIAGTARFVIGPPIKTAGKKPGQVTAETRDWIESEVEKLEYNQ